MSKGPGKIERAVERFFADERDNAFTTEDLCDRIYGAAEKKHRVSVIRAGQRLRERQSLLYDWYRSENLGGQLVFFRRDSVLSYAMARLKSDNLNNYRDRNPRIWGPETEEDLRKKLSEREHYVDLIKPGGAWWKTVQSWIAELEADRAGDKERAQEIRAKREAEEAASYAQYLQMVRSI